MFHTMELKEKIVAVGIALMFASLVITLTNQIFDAEYYSHCIELYPYPHSNSGVDPLETARSACVEENRLLANFNSLMRTISLMGLALIALVIGSFIVKIDSISVCLIGGSILTLIFSIVLYFFVSQTQFEKTILLSIGFVVLLAVAYFKFTKKAK